MPDGSLYVNAAYALTVAVLLGYALHLVRLGRRLRRREVELTQERETPGDAPVTRVTSHV